MIMRIITGIIVFASFAFGNYYAFKADNFDFHNAGAEERRQWLRAKAIGMKRRFKPDLFAKVEHAEARGSQLVFHYSMTDNADRCFRNEMCEELQCRRYFGSSLDRQSIPVLLVYFDGRGRKVGHFRVADSTCRDFREE
ncbi:MAG: hypothetical protein AAFY34_10380 [Pseudomonadota bacterium]